MYLKVHKKGCWSFVYAIGVPCLPPFAEISQAPVGRTTQSTNRGSPRLAAPNWHPGRVLQSVPRSPPPAFCHLLLT